MGFSLYLMGHGCYRPKNEFFVLPKGFTMHFYAEHGKALPVRELQPILRGLGEPKRSFAPFSSVPNYTWQNGETANWNFYVTGQGPDLRKRSGLSQRMPGPNDNLKSNRRGIDWDVRYVQHFKTLAGLQMNGEYTLKMLIESASAQEYFADKGTPVEIHVLLCSVVEMNTKWR